MKRHWLDRTTSLCSTSTFVLGLCVVLPVYANPQGGQVAAGSTSQHTSGNHLAITQHTDKAVIDWRSFDIEAGESTTFHQPSRDSVVLNRVNSHDPSRIMGSLSANGNVMLVNPNGVLFGRDSKVDVGGLIATTSNITNQDFMAGNLHFNATGNPDATITNKGHITAKDAGLVGLVAPNVQNHGVIQAKLGKVQLASGDQFSVDLYGDGLVNMAVSDKVGAQLVANTGSISAEGGTIALTAAAGRDIVNSLIHVEGELHAPSIQQHEGKIIIAAEGSNAVIDNIASIKGSKIGTSVINTGNALLDVSGQAAGAQGGQISITADQISLFAGTILDASGTAPVPIAKPSTGISADTSTVTAQKHIKTEAEFLASPQRGGGSIKVGGDYLGSGTTPTATNTYIAANSTILNNGSGHGDGGRTIIWADRHTGVRGRINAQGGQLSGNGGFVETSGKNTLNVGSEASIIASAPNGQSGLWLLDPENVNISNVQNNGAFNGGTPNIFTPINSLSNVDVANIKATLDSGTSVTINTGSTGVQNGDIRWTAGATLSTNSAIDRTLTLSAANNIFLNTSDNNITATGTGKLNVHFLADNDGVGDGAVQLFGATINTNGGDFIAAGGTDPLDIGTPMNMADSSARGNASIDDGVRIGGGSIINTGAGNAILRGIGDNDAAASSNRGVEIDDLQLTSTGLVSIYGEAINGTSGNRGISVISSTLNVDRIELVGIGGAANNTAVTSGNNQGIYFSNSNATIGSNLTATGTGGSGDANDTSVHGIELFNSNITSPATANITMTGTGGTTGGDGANGVYFRNESSIDTDGIVSMTGTGGTSSVQTSGVRLDSPGGSTGNPLNINAGTLTIMGTGGNSTTNTGRGITLFDEVHLTANNDMTITGIGGTSAVNNRGIAVNGNGSGGNINRLSITSTNGNVTMTGSEVGGGAGNDYNVILFEDVDVSSPNGSITLNGNSGASLVDTRLGSRVNTLTAGDDITLSGALVTTDNDETLSAGDTITYDIDNSIGLNGGAGTVPINITYYQIITAANTVNFGGASTDAVTIDPNWDLTPYDFNVGVKGSSITADNITTNAAQDLTLTSTGTDITLNGDLTLGGSFFADAEVDISATAAGKTIASTNGSMTFKAKDDIFLRDNTITSNGNNVTVWSNSDNVAHGAIVMSNNSVSSAGGAILLAGGLDDGANGGTANDGIPDGLALGNTSNRRGITLTGTTLDAGSGSLLLKGEGHSADPTFTGNVGVQLDTSTMLKASGNGSITLNGIGGNSTQASNRGIRILDSTIDAKNNATIDLTGKGGTGDTFTEGVRVDTNAFLLSEDGDITINSQAGNATTNTDRGITVNTGTIRASGAGNISITATAGNSNVSNPGIFIINGSTIDAKQGNITLTGTTDAASALSDLRFAGTKSFLGSAAMTGNITLNNDTARLDNNTIADIQTQGNVIIQPRTAGTAINIGNAVGGLDLTQAELGAIQSAGTIVVGDTVNAGTLTVSDTIDLSAIATNASLIADSVILNDSLTTNSSNILSITADNGSITRTGGTLTANTLNLDATGSITADIISNKVDIGTGGSGTTLTGIIDGGVDQPTADRITGGPGNNDNYTFEGFTIRLSTARDDNIVTEAVTTPDVSNDTPAAPTDNLAPIENVSTVENTPETNSQLSSISIPNTVVITSQASRQNLDVNPDIQRNSESSFSSGSTFIIPDGQNDKNLLSQIGKITIHPRLAKLFGLKKHLSEN